MIEEPDGPYYRKSTKPHELPQEYWLDFTISLVTGEEPSYILTENLRDKIEQELRVWKHDPGIVVSFVRSRQVDKVENEWHVNDADLGIEPQEATGGN